MTVEQILEQLFDNNYVEETFQIANGKIEFKLRTLSADDYLEIDQKLKNLKGTQLFVLQTLALEKLSRSVKSFNGKTNVDCTTPEKVRDYLKDLPVAVIDILIKKQTSFEKDVKEAISPEAIEENFFDKPGFPEKPKQ